MCSNRPRSARRPTHNRIDLYTSRSVQNLPYRISSTKVIRTLPSQRVLPKASMGFLCIVLPQRPCIESCSLHNLSVQSIFSSEGFATNAPKRLLKLSYQVSTMPTRTQVNTGLTSNCQYNFCQHFSPRVYDFDLNCHIRLWDFASISELTHPSVTAVCVRRLKLDRHILRGVLLWIMQSLVSCLTSDNRDVCILLRPSTSLTIECLLFASEQGRSSIVEISIVEFSLG